MTDSNMTMASSYDYRLVALSVLSRFSPPTPHLNSQDGQRRHVAESVFVKAVCGNSACPDLWRGLWATMIPTPTNWSLHSCAGIPSLSVHADHQEPQG